MGCSASRKKLNKTLQHPQDCSFLQPVESGQDSQREHAIGCTKETFKHLKIDSPTRMKYPEQFSAQVYNSYDGALLKCRQLDEIKGDSSVSMVQVKGILKKRKSTLVASPMSPKSVNFSHDSILRDDIKKSSRYQSMLRIQSFVQSG